jgi:hypothetical protein
VTETQDEGSKGVLRELEGKNIAHYSVLLQTWIHTRMERDRTVVTLAAAGVGLLVTILTTVGVQARWMIVLYATAFVGFLLTICLSIVIYQKNSVFIEWELRGGEGSGGKPVNLKPYDRLSLSGFVVGAAFLAVTGLCSAWITYQLKEEKPVSKSVERPKPQEPQEKKSLDGLQNVRPQPAPSREPSPQPASPPNQPQPGAPAPASGSVK